MRGRLWRLPTSKSLKSWPGVILTAPVPFSGSECSSATIGMRRFASGKHDVPADQRLVARIVGMHRDRGVAEHGLRPRRGDGDEMPRLPLDRIFDVPEMPLHLDALDFEIGDGGLQAWVPVDQTLVLVDEALLVEFDEDLQDRARKPLVHREAFARPIGRGAEAAQLLADGAAGFVLPLPHRFEEFLAPHRDAALLALGKLAFDDELGGDAGMVGARLPQHVLAAHALETGERVLDRIVQCVADMQAAGDVGRRDDDAERLGPRTAPRAERPGLHPLRIDAALDLFGREGLVEHGQANLLAMAVPGW